MTNSPLHSAREALNKGQWKRARSLFKKVLTTSPGDPAAVGGMGFACLQMARRSSGVRMTPEQTRRMSKEAAFYLKQAALTDRSDRTYRLLGEAHVLNGDYDLAEVSFRDALNNNPNSAESWNQFGRLLVDLGKKAEAIEAFEAALKITPEFADAWHQVRRLQKSTEPEVELESARAAIAKPTDFPIGRSALHMAAGRICEQLERFGDAYTHFKSAAEVKPAPQPFLPSLAERTDAIERCLDRDFFEQRAAWGDPTATPIFVIGLPRSGTTLTEQILDAHRQIVGVGELTDIAAAKHELIRRSSGWLPGSHPLLQATAGHVRHLAVQHGSMLHTISNGGSIVVDKMPGNFAHLDVIKLMFPNARIVHCTRDPRDVWISCLRNNLDRPYTSINEFSEYQANYVRVLDHWDEVFGDQIFHLNYESFVQHPEPVVRKLIAYCGLEWDDNCLRHFESDRAVRTPSKLAVRQPVYTSSVGTWERNRPAIDSDVQRLTGVELTSPAGTAWQPASGGSASNRSDAKMSDNRTSPASRMLA